MKTLKEIKICDLVSHRKLCIHWNRKVSFLGFFEDKIQKLKESVVSQMHSSLIILKVSKKNCQFFNTLRVIYSRISLIHLNLCLI